MEDEKLYDDDDDYSKVRLKKIRGGNSTSTVANATEWAWKTWNH